MDVSAMIINYHKLSAKLYLGVNLAMDNIWM